MREPLMSVLTSVYRGENYLESFLSSLTSQTLFPDFEVLLDLNQPSTLELEMVANFESRYPGVVKAEITQQVVPLGQSWNRCLARAVSPFCAIWNIDDRRTPTSLEIQLRELVGNPSALVCYGPFMVVTSLDSHKGRLEPCIAKDYRDLSRGMYFGPFMAFRKAVVESIGPFDEQLISGSDYDFATRCALSGPAIRSNELLGYFLDIGQGFSTRRGSSQAVERTFIELRYGVFDKVETLLVPLTVPYSTKHILFGGEWHLLTHVFPQYESHIGNAIENYAESSRTKFRRSLNAMRAGAKARINGAMQSVFRARKIPQ